MSKANRLDHFINDWRELERQYKLAITVTGSLKNLDGPTLSAAVDAETLSRFIAGHCKGIPRDIMRLIAKYTSNLHVVA